MFNQAFSRKYLHTKDKDIENLLSDSEQENCISMYSFQNAAKANIQYFKNSILQYTLELFSPRPIEEII